MGIIDSATVRLSCPACGLVESSRIMDSGNRWSGSDWDLPSFRKFRATVTGGHKVEPEVVGTCLGCGTSADAATGYGP